LTAGLQLAKKLRPAGCPPARRHHLVSPGDIISESAGDFVGICNQQEQTKIDQVKTHGNFHEERAPSVLPEAI
jgi:hypothetical protein